jgi:hypothetical protein
MTPDLSEPNDRMTESNYHALPKCLPECEAVPIADQFPAAAALGLAIELVQHAPGCPVLAAEDDPA